MAELRSFIFLNRLQPQTMCYLGTWIRGSLPRSDVAAQIIEVAPGLDIEPVTDVALKHAGVRAGILVVERQFGYLEIHGGNDEVRAAATRRWTRWGYRRGTLQAGVLASKIISMLDPQHAFLINRNKIGSMALAGESLFVLEMQPASYAILAANEAEKAARIKVVDYRMIGATGRVYLSGSEADIRQAAEAAEDALGAERHDRLPGRGPRGHPRRWCGRCWPTCCPRLPGPGDPGGPGRPGRGWPAGTPGGPGRPGCAYRP